MIHFVVKTVGVAAAGALFWSAAAVAQQPQQRQANRPQAPQAAPSPKDAGKPSALGSLGGGSKEPIKIDADRLDVFDREHRAVFTGNVVAVQGDSTIQCSKLTVLYERPQQGGTRAAPATGQAESSIKQIDCAGPVTVVSKDQIATGDNALFDRVANKVVLTGNVALSQCQNVTRGEKLVYDLNSGIANFETAPGGRVKALFVPGGGGDEKKQQEQGCAQPAQPVAAPAPRPRAQVN